VRADHSQLEAAALGAAPGQALAPGQGQKALNRRTRARNLRGDQLGLAAPVDDIVVAEFGGVSLFKERPAATGGPSASERDPIGSLCRQPWDTALASSPGR
jgi:hypothetical protein